MKRLTTFIVPGVLTAFAIGCSTQRYQSSTVPLPGPVRAATSEPNLIPAGTTLVIRTNQAIHAQQAGQTYAAEIAESVEDQTGRILIPRGSPAELVVAQVSGGGTAGTPVLELAVRSINVNGMSYAVASDTSLQQGPAGIGRNRRTAEMVGGGALLGTLIGAVAGGGKGAVVGALSGAAGGAAVQVLTRGKEIEVPAETLLTFRLEDSLRLSS
jgi:hypothetical protein